MTPDTLWPIAIVGEVKEKGNPQGVILPIVRVIMCPTTVTVIRAEYPQGVILLNNTDPPQSVAPYDFAYQKESGQSVQVDISDNAGWPYNERVVLFVEE